MESEITSKEIEETRLNLVTRRTSLERRLEGHEAMGRMFAIQQLTLAIAEENYGFVLSKAKYHGIKIPDEHLKKAADWYSACTTSESLILARDAYRSLGLVKESRALYGRILEAFDNEHVEDRAEIEQRQ